MKIFSNFRFVCDNWIEIRFLSSLAGEKFIMKICKIRSMWEKLLNHRLQGKKVKLFDRRGRIAKDANSS